MPCGACVCAWALIIHVCGRSYSTLSPFCPPCLLLQEVVDIEESIWSTKYGVKGMIDVRCGCPSARWWSGVAGRKGFVPAEDANAYG